MTRDDLEVCVWLWLGGSGRSDPIQSKYSCLLERAAHHHMILETVCDSTLLCIYREAAFPLYSFEYSNQHPPLIFLPDTHRSWLAYDWMDVGQTNTAPDPINRSPSLFAQLKCNLLALELLHKGGWWTGQARNNKFLLRALRFAIWFQSVQKYQ